MGPLAQLKQREGLLWFGVPSRIFNFKYSYPTSKMLFQIDPSAFGMRLLRVEKSFFGRVERLSEHDLSMISIKLIFGVSDQNTVDKQTV